MKRAITIVATLLLVSIFSIYFNGHAAQPNKTSVKNKEVLQKNTVKEIQSYKEVSAIIDSSHNKLLIFDLYAPWCGPCRMLAPVIESLAEKYGAQAAFYKVNIDELSDVAAAFGVSGIPHVVFVKNKTACGTLVGLHQRSEYEQIITINVKNKISGDRLTNN
jgi:thioredoxin 1